MLAGPRHLARIALKGPQHVLAAAASPDGSLVAVSDAASVRLYQARITAVGARICARHGKLISHIIATLSDAPKVALRGFESDRMTLLISLLMLRL